MTEAQADDAVARIFDGTYEQRKSSKAALQFHIYDRMAQKDGIALEGDTICNSLYATSDLFRNVPAVMPVSERFTELMDERLQAVVDEIRSKEVPFRRTEEVEACRYCDFKMICGR